ncbi:MAG TPA: hypothetical protein DCS48_07340 [Desulfovibrio sp.]|nr:hypothetical protein [Desulfovibrio sp.]
MTVDMQQLLKLEPYDAFRMALEMSGKSEKEVAKEMGYEFSNCHRIFSMEPYYTSYEKLIQMCEVLGNNIIILWLIAHADHAVNDHPIEHEEVDCVCLLKDSANLFKETSEVGRAASEAIEDGVLELHEVRRVIRELMEVNANVFSMVGKLRKLERNLADAKNKSKAQSIST